MGWLRDLITASELRTKSLGHLAAVTLDQADWPSDVEIQPRSFAALLGKLDRGQELGWLAARAGVQLALARALGTEVDAVTRGLRLADAEEQRSRRLLRLQDLGPARPLDLWEEPLPPGLPDLDTSATAPARWWLAPRGAGRTLVGRWLEARGRARYLAPEPGSWFDRDARSVLYVELDETHASAPPALRARPGLIVAAPFAPPVDAGFELVSPPELGTFIDPLVAWASERLPADSKLVPERIGRFLGERVASGEATTFGAALGWLGLADEHGVRAFEGRSAERLVQRYVEERLLRAIDPKLSHASWLRQHGFAALVGLVERTLVDSERHPGAARSLDEWLALVPRDLERTVDVDWVRLSLKNVDSGVRPSELERAARRLPPGAYRLVNALEQAGILRRLTDGRLKLGPAFVAEVVEQRALLALAARSPVEWGEALLRREVAPRLVEILLDRALSSGAALLEPVLDLGASDQPEHAVTFELALRIAGLTRLMGGDVSQELLDALWADAPAVLVELEGEPPRPSVELALAVDSGGPRAARGRSVLERGTLYLALLAISETLRRSSRQTLRGLSPWSASAPPAELPAVYDAIVAALAARPPWYAAALRLIGRLRASVGNVRGADQPHPLEAPSQFLDEVEHGVVGFAAFERAPPALEAVLALARPRRIEASAIAEALWAAWHDAGNPPRPRPFARDSGWAELVFRHATPERLERWLESHPELDLDLAWLAPDVLRALGHRPELAANRQALELLPPDVLESVLRSPELRARAAPALDVVWTRAPTLAEQALRAELASAATTRPPVLRTLLRATPEPLRARAVAALGRDERVVLLPDAGLAVVRDVLQRWSSPPECAWRDAFLLLRRIERERQLL